MIRCLIILFLFFLIPAKIFAQTDIYPGTWQMEYFSGKGAAPVSMELQIAVPDKNVLYPALLKLQCDSFKAVYEFLLVKKNNWELGISKNKRTVSETLFDLGNFPFFLNGIFEYEKDLKGLPLLTIRRVQSKQTGPPLFDTLKLTTTQKKMAASLRFFLKDAEIVLKKINNNSWQHADRDVVLSPVLSPTYFGLLDTMHIQSRYATIDLASLKKTGTDIASVTLNGHTIVDQLLLSKKKHVDEIILDTGLNILTLFADNFGSSLPNAGKLNIESSTEKFSLDLTRKADSAATFVVAKLYCFQDKGKEISFQNNYVPGEENLLKENERLIGSIVSTSRQITLAIWDDAMEDGDSISINIEGKWLVQGFPVKKNPQFITVTLNPGPNTINFIADNLGSIPPNTSVLEIIDGKKRKSFFMETNLGENNLIKIFYDLNGSPK